MKKNKFDIHARNLLNGLETPVNTDALWDNVHEELYPEKKKKIFGWIWFSASGFLSVLLLLAYIYISNHTSLEQSIILNDKVIQKIEATSKNEAGKSISTTKDSPVSTTNILESKIEINEYTIPKKKVTRQQTFKNEVNSSAAKLNTNKAVQKNSDTAPENTPYSMSTPQATNMTNQSILNNHAPETQEIKNNGPQNNTAKNLKTKTQDLLKSETPIETKDTLNTKTIDGETKSLIIAAEEGIDKVLQENEATTQDITVAEKDAKTEDDAMSENNDARFGRKFKRNFQLGAGFRAGIANSLTTLIAKEDVDTPLRNLRNESERNLETIDLGLDVLVKHKSGVYLSTGIDYLRTARKLEFNEKGSVEDSILGISAIFVNPITMDSTFEQGMIVRTTTSTTIREIYNNLHLVNIPINLGVTFDYERWTFGLQGGASFNVLLKLSGQIRSGEDSFYDLEEDSANWFKDNLDVSYQGAVIVGYNFTDNFQIVGGPSFRSSLVISEDINPIRQSQVGLGLQVSARYWFD